MTIPEQIIRYIEEQGGWVWGGTLCRAIHDLSGHKESVIERRARELVEYGFLDKELVQVDGKGPKCVRYRIVELKQYVEEFGKRFDELFNPTLL